MGIILLQEGILYTRTISTGPSLQWPHALFYTHISVRWGEEQRSWLFTVCRAWGFRKCSEIVSERVLRMCANLCSQSKTGTPTLLIVTTHRTKTPSTGHCLHWHGTLYRQISAILTATCPLRQNQASSQDTTREGPIYSAYTPEDTSSQNSVLLRDLRCRVIRT